MNNLVKGRGDAASASSDFVPLRVHRSLHLRRTKNVLWNVVPFLVIVSVWELAVVLGRVPPQMFPSVEAVVSKFFETVASGQFAVDAQASLGRIAVGAGLAIVTGIPFGILMGTVKPIADFFSPLLRFSVGVSGIAWVPLATLWLGYGPLVCIFIIWNSVFFAVVYSTMLGVGSMNRDLMRAAETQGAGPLRIFFEVLLPGSLPAIMTGLRSGLGYGWRGLIAAEMIATSAGFGYSIFVAQKYYDTAEIVLLMITLGVLWLTIDRALLGPLERRTITRWGMMGGIE